jgi:tripartite-type tricarboxylate transporter receptor subunit TctC
MRKTKRDIMRELSSFAAALILASTVATSVPAQIYPSKQIELVVPFVAGGTTDIVARMIAQHFADTWSATAIVNNRPGGGSMIGTGAVAKSPPDGHTLPSPPSRLRSMRECRSCRSIQSRTSRR